MVVLFVVFLASYVFLWILEKSGKLDTDMVGYELYACGLTALIVVLLNIFIYFLEFDKFHGEIEHAKTEVIDFDEHYFKTVYKGDTIEIHYEKIDSLLLSNDSTTYLEYDYEPQDSTFCSNMFKYYFLPINSNTSNRKLYAPKDKFDKYSKLID